MNAAFLLAAGAAIVPSAPLADAVERQREAVREAVEWNPCRAGASVEEIVVCGRLDAPAPLAPASDYDPGRDFRPPERGPWFQWRRGPLTISCCAVSTDRGTGAGLGLSLRF